MRGMRNKNVKLKARSSKSHEHKPVTAVKNPYMRPVQRTPGSILHVSVEPESDATLSTFISRSHEDVIGACGLPLRPAQSRLKSANKKEALLCELMRKHEQPGGCIKANRIPAANARLAGTARCTL